MRKKMSDNQEISQKLVSVCHFGCRMWRDNLSLYQDKERHFSGKSRHTHQFRKWRRKHAKRHAEKFLIRQPRGRWRKSRRRNKSRIGPLHPAEGRPRVEPEQTTHRQARPVGERRPLQGIPHRSLCLSVGRRYSEQHASVQGAHQQERAHRCQTQQTD